MRIHYQALLAFVALFSISAFTIDNAQAENLIRNGLFAEHTDGVPADWSIRDNKQEVTIDTVEAKHPDIAQALRVDILSDGGSSYGQIAQSLAVRPGTTYRFEGDWRSSRGQTAFFEIKLIRDRKELERINLGWSQQAWQRVVRYINCGDADKIEVLCRYRQKKDFTGIICWYTNLSLSKVADGAKTEDSVTAISEPIAPPPVKAPTFDFPAENPDLKIAAPGKNQYVTPTGAGNRSGTDWENAAAATGDGLQAAWDATGPGNTLYLGSGEYKDAILEIKAGGSGPDAMRRLQGVDTGAGLPVFAGSLDMDDIKNGWQTMLVGTADTGYWSLDGLSYRNCSCAVKLYGGNVGVRISHLDISRVREAFTLEGMDNPRENFAMRDIEISDCTVSIYTKRGIRIRDGVSDLRVQRVKVDAGGKEWFREAFPIGFQISSELDMPECRNITFTDCTASGNWYPNGDKYWNADGFCAERRVRDLKYVRCMAYNNTDGGWDDKSVNPTLIDCVSLRNKRNFRFWSDPGPAVLQNCVSGYAVDYRSGKPGIGLWQASGSNMQVERSTFYANGCAVQVEAGGGRSSICKLTKCILAGAKDAKLVSVEGGAEVVRVDTVECTIGDAETDPQLKAPTANWSGDDDAFNSRRYPDRGASF